MKQLHEVEKKGKHTLSKNVASIETWQSYPSKKKVILDSYIIISWKLYASKKFTEITY